MAETTYGIVISWQPGSSSQAVEVFQAPDDGSGSPNTASGLTIATVPAGQVYYADYLPNDNQFRHYRVRHVKSGYISGAYTGYVRAKPVAIQLGYLGTVGDQTALGQAAGFPSSYSIGDLLYASATSTLSKLAAVATGNLLVSQGLTTAPTWGKLATSHLSGDYTFPGALTATTGTFSGLLTAQAGVTITSGQALLWSADNAAGSTVGAAVANRPRTIHVGNNLVVGSDINPGTAGVDVSAGNVLLTRFATGGAITGQRANGSFGAESAVLSGDVLVSLQLAGHDGSAYALGARVSANTAENWSGTAHGATLIFATVAVGSTTITNRWNVTAGGHFSPAVDNTYDAGQTTGNRIRTVAAYTGDFATRVTAPLLGTTSAVDVVIDRNSVTKVTITSADIDFVGAVDSDTGFKKSGTQVHGARRTGWATSGWTVSQSRAAFNPATVSLTTLAQAVQALIDDFGANAHGSLDAVVAA